jgi:hypothetical protein
LGARDEPKASPNNPQQLGDAFGVEPYNFQQLMIGKTFLKTTVTGHLYATLRVIIARNCSRLDTVEIASV